MPYCRQIAVPGWAGDQADSIKNDIVGCRRQITIELNGDRQVIRLAWGVFGRSRNAKIIALTVDRHTPIMHSAGDYPPFKRQRVPLFGRQAIGQT